MISRISTINPDLEKRLDAMSGSERRELGCRIIMLIAGEVGLNSLSIEQLLKDENHAQLENAAKEFDNQYIELQELGEPEYMAAFSKARCYSAAAYLAHNDIKEAAYEAISASGSPDNIIRIIKGEAPREA